MSTDRLREMASDTTKRKASPNLVGRRVKLIRSNDPYSDVYPGTLGTVVAVDDLGTLHVKWDSGQELGLIWDSGDRWQILPKKK